VKLTETGETLRRRASDLLRQADSIRDDISRRGDAPSGVMRIGANPSLGNTVFPSLARSYTARYPEVRLHFVTDMTVHTAVPRGHGRRPRGHGGTCAIPRKNAHRLPLPTLVTSRSSAMALNGKTLFITGASRGIGLAVALRAARDGANIAIAAKTQEPHPKLPGTIHTAATEVEAAGGRALPLAVDIRDEDAVKDAIERTAAHFGGIDIVVNNASAITLTPVAATEMRRFDLMHQVNTRGTFMVSKYAIPHLAKASNPHILMMSPPLDMAEKWFSPHTAYTMAKFGMSMVALGLAGELRAQGIAVNALWPRTTIATAAIRNLLGGDEIMRRSRRPDILAEAAYRIFAKPAASFSGQFLIDDTFLAGEGVTDFEPYRVDPGEPLMSDFFVPDDIKAPPGVMVAPREER
jgi:citronellol/citronellal dehydrogenase